MAPSTLDPRRPTIVPVRDCSKCGHVDDVFHLTMVSHVWLCKPCYGSLAFPGTHEAAVDVEHETDEELERLARDRALLHRVDVTMQWLRVGGRFVAYAAMMLLSWSSPVFAAILFGLFVADATSWVATAWFDARFHQGTVTFEAVLYTVTFLVMQTTGMLDLPTDPGLRALAGLAAILVFGLRGLVFWHRLRF